MVEILKTSLFPAEAGFIANVLNIYWEYKTSFSLTTATLKLKYVELVFDGLDTYAKVYLNDKLVLKADNMFRQWRVDVRQHLKVGKNELRVVFKSAQNIIDSLAQKDLPFVIPDNPRA